MSSQHSWVPLLEHALHCQIPYASGRKTFYSLYGRDSGLSHLNFKKFFLNHALSEFISGKCWGNGRPPVPFEETQWSLTSCQAAFPSISQESWIGRWGGQLSFDLIIFLETGRSERFVFSFFCLVQVSDLWNGCPALCSTRTLEQRWNSLGRGSERIGENKGVRGRNKGNISLQSPRLLHF